MNNCRFSALAALIDKRYLRETGMNAAGLYSFAPRLRFEESVCRSSEELQEAREIGIQITKNELDPDPAFTEAIMKQTREAQQRYAESRNFWDRMTTAHNRYMEKYRMTEYEKFSAQLKPFKDETNRLWREEIQRFSSDYVSGLLEKGKREPSRTALYKKLMGDGLGSFGFMWDKEASSSQFLIYSKNLYGSAQLRFCLDLVSFRQPMSRPSTIVGTGEILVAGPSFEVWMEIWICSEKKRLPFDYWFPILGGYLQTAYKQFRTTQELEALIEIYLALYRIIQPEMDEAIENDLRDVPSGVRR